MCSYYFYTLHSKFIKPKNDTFVLFYDVLKWQKSRYISIDDLNSDAMRKGWCSNPRRDRPKLLKQEVPAQHPNGRQQV